MFFPSRRSVVPKKVGRAQIKFLNTVIIQLAALYSEHSTSEPSKYWTKINSIQILSQDDSKNVLYADYCRDR